jgi:hypothetical protein
MPRVSKTVWDVNYGSNSRSVPLIPLLPSSPTSFSPLLQIPLLHTMRSANLPLPPTQGVVLARQARLGAVLAGFLLASDGFPVSECCVWVKRGEPLVAPISRMSLN